MLLLHGTGTRPLTTRRRVFSTDGSDTGQRAATAARKQRRSLFSFANLGNVFKINEHRRATRSAMAAAAGDEAGADGSEGAAATHATPKDDWDEELMGPRPRRLWQGLDGLAVMIFGIVLPLFTFASSCMSIPKRLTLVLLNHPLETIAELSLTALLPVINYLIWSALCKHKIKHPKLAAIGIGCNIATSIVVSAGCVAMMFAPSTGVSEGTIGPGLAWLAILSLASAAIGGYLIHSVRATRLLSTNRHQVLFCSSLGFLSAVSIFAASEIRPWFVRLAEQSALSTNKLEAKKAFSGKAHHKKNLLTPNKVPVTPHFVVETVERVAAAAPKHLVIVIDGSESTKPYVEKITAALKQLPVGIKADVILASQESKELSKPVPLGQALNTIDKVPSVGGQDNLRSVVDAAELAGDSASGAVLWIHGPQPALNQEIYLMSAYVAAPKFYELTLGTEQIDTLELFKNHPEIGPFAQVPRYSSNIADDLKAFLNRWQPGDSSYAVKLLDTTKLPNRVPLLPQREQIEVLALHAKQDCDDLLAHKHTVDATRLAVSYGFVSPTSCAIIDPNARNIGDKAGTGVDDNGGAFNTLSQTRGSDSTVAINTFSSPLGCATEAGDGYTAAPMLQGTTNGTIGPQATDATVITGINTAGTVRVNNLANLEALLNIIANLGEVVMLGAGLVLLVLGLMGKGSLMEIMGREIEITPGERITIGALLMIAGLALPGMINWFVASARDANLFS